MVATRHAPDYFRTTPFFESYLAVDFFFVLSGFILAHAYGAKLRAGDIGVWEFTKIRIVRLFPLYLLAHMIVSAFAVQSIGQEGLTHAVVIKSIVFGMFMLPTPSANNASALFPLNGPAWSLFFEMVVNIVFAFISTRKSSRRLILAVVTLSAGSMIVAVYFRLLGFGTRAGVFDSGFYWSTFGVGIIRVMYSFFLGTIVYEIWCYRPSPRVPALVPALALILVLAAYPAPTMLPTYDLLAVLFAFPLLIWIAASADVSRGIIFRACSLLGLSSYAVYVLQVPVYDITALVTEDLFGLGPLNGFRIVFLLWLCVVALFAHHFYDVALRRYLTAKFIKKA